MEIKIKMEENKVKDYPLTLEEFKAIYSKVPRLTVEVIIKSEKGVLLTKREIEPYKGAWHLPGGTVYIGEKLADAVARVAKKELGIQVIKSDFIGYIEYSNYHKIGFDCPLGMAFKVEYEGDIQLDEEASEAEWFNKLPDNVPIDQVKFINEKVL